MPKDAMPDEPGLGEWAIRLSPAQSGLVVYRESDEEIIATVHGDLDRALSNALLIARAPTLRDTLASIAGVLRVIATHGNEREKSTALDLLKMTADALAPLEVEPEVDLDPVAQLDADTIQPRPNSKCAPDYGAYLHDQGTKPEARQFYYEVPIRHLDVTHTLVLTTTINRIEGEREFAVSFDFLSRAIGQLLEKAPSGLLGRLQEAAVAKEPRDRRVEIVPPMVVSLECELGPLQSNAREMFAPLVVQRILSFSNASAKQSGENSEAGHV